MAFLRKIGLLFSSSSMRLFLFVSISFTVLAIIVSNSAYVKNALLETKAYNRFVPAIIEANIKQDQTANSIPFNNPEVQKIINSSFTPESLKDKSETLIDSFFAWLRGKTDKPEFKLDFTKEKQELAEELSEYAFNNLKSLPRCFFNPTEIDPFYANCRPSNMDFEAEQKQLESQIFTTDSFLKDTVLTQDDFAKDSKGKTFIDKYWYAPIVYRWLLRLPWIFGTLTIVSATGYIVMSRRKREGVNVMGLAILTSSMSLVLLTVIFGFVVPYYTKNFNLGLGGTGAQKIMDDALNSLMKNVDSMIINVGIQAAVVGVLIVIFERFTRPESKYDKVSKKAGITSGFVPRGKTTKSSPKMSGVPIVSSDAPNKANNKTRNSKKYRKIPRGDI
jgi:hypothetical protein